MTQSRRRGFTLIEVLVAISVAAIVTLMARVALQTLSDGGQWQKSYAVASSEEANGERTLVSLVNQVQVSAADSLFFQGQESSASFTSWCAAAEGWEERCAVRIQAYPGTDSLGLWLGTDSLVVRRRSRVVGLRYLADAHDGGTWLRGWGADLTPPAAIEVLGASDTLILRVGDRG